MWSKETKEEKERKKEQAFYEHYGAMGKSTDSIRKEWERRKRNEQRIRRLKRRRRIAIILILFVVLVPAVSTFTYFKMNPIVLRSKVIAQEKKESMDLMSNIRFVVGGKAKDVKTEGKVDTNKEGKYTVSEISFMVGYNTPSYFAARFKKYIGCLPTEYGKK